MCSYDPQESTLGLLRAPVHTWSYDIDKCDCINDIFKVMGQYLEKKWSMRYLKLVSANPMYS